MALINCWLGLFFWSISRGAPERRKEEPEHRIEQVYRIETTTIRKDSQGKLVFITKIEPKSPFSTNRHKAVKL